MNYTDNYNLNLPSITDGADISKLNENFTEIDSVLKEHETAIEKNKVTTDQTYTPTSTNPQSGIAVAEAMANVEADVDENFVKQEEGKGLSTNDFTNKYKKKLDNLDAPFSQSARELLISILESGLYETDVSEKISQLATELAGPEYTQLNYLETGYDTDVAIYTGATVGATDKVEIVFGLSYAPQWNYILGQVAVFTFVSRLNALYLIDKATGLNETIYTFDNLTTDNAGTEWVDNLKCIIDSTTLSLYDGDGLLLKSIEFTSKTAFKANLFSYGGSSKSYYTRIRDVKIYSSDDTLKYHFIPVEDANGTLCMYDTVNKNYHYNSGTGTFISGGEIDV